MPDAAISVRTADWRTDQAAIRAVRHAVFITEQGIPAALEWDGLDGDCRHVLAHTAAGVAVATGRLTLAGRIGRMAVLPAWRGHGVGRALLEQLLLQAAALGLQDVYLHAQRAAVAFYLRQGFQQTGVPFVAAGIEHVRMSRRTAR
ncbi:MAG: GNAT family N-acetyltransferase [Pseudomonadota bacterium]